jgi:hypothetical protein
LHLQSLAPTPVSRRVDVRQDGVKIIAESLSRHDKKHVVLTSLSGIRVGKRKRRRYCHKILSKSLFMSAREMMKNN